MAKVSPLIRSFNSGEFSVLMEGRTDIDRYPSSLRSMLDYIAAPQGAAIPRSGTEFINSIYDETSQSLLVPFVFSETDFYMIEFAAGRIRFFTEDGALVKTPVLINVTSVAPFQFKSGDLNAAIGDQVAFEGFPAMYNLNGEIGNITDKSGAGADTLYTVDTVHPPLPLLDTATGALVYSIPSPYGSDDLPLLFDLQSLDVVYLYHPKKRKQKLQRRDTYDWSFVDVTYIDGPYLTTNETLTTLVADVTGKATPDMTANAVPDGTCFGDSNYAAGPTASDFWYAFDDPSADSYWRGNVVQTGIIGYQASAAFVCDGYCIHVGINNDDVSYTSQDFAPSTWYFEGSNDGATYVTLDKQNNYVLYDNNKSAFFKIPNVTAYLYYRLRVLSCTRNGTVQPSVRSLVMRSPASTALNITASDILGINNDVGFLETDVGRLLRMEGSDGTWRQLVITAWTDSMHIAAQLLGEPFADLVPTANWRVGAYSETSGYPDVATFYQDRVWEGGCDQFPDLLSATNSGLYENFTPTSDDGTVLDTHGICVRLNSRKLSRIKWLAGGKDGLLLGTGSEERIVRPADNSGKVITPSNIKADPVSSRGSSSCPVAAIDQQVLFIQRGGRTVREFAYSYDIDSYKSPSMSQLASHLGVSSFTRMQYAAEPYSIVWFLRGDGTIVGLTYNRDENVVGWHRHSFSGAVIESIAVMPSSDQRQDVLWVIARRYVNGVQRRYIEKLTRFWDFDMVLNDAWYVDCGLKYSGIFITEVFGLQHLEDYVLYGLADGVPVGPLRVKDGSVVLPQPASVIVLGIGFDASCETSSLENGAQDGTALGKNARITNISALLWASYGGEFGVWNNDTNQIEFFPVQDQVPPLDASLDAPVQLATSLVGPLIPDGNYAKDKTISFRRRADTPLPLNIVAIMPQMNTQDRG